MYSSGLGVRQDYQKSLEWYQKAANQNYAKAQFNLGVMYQAGQGVRQDNHKAKSYYGQSCDNGFQAGCDAYRNLNIRGF